MLEGRLARALEAGHRRKEKKVISALEKSRAAGRPEVDDWNISAQVRRSSNPLISAAKYLLLGDVTTFRAIDRLVGNGSLKSRREDPTNKHSRKLYSLPGKVPTS